MIDLRAKLVIKKGALGRGCVIRDELSLALFERITVLGPLLTGHGAHFEVCAIISGIRPNRVYPKGTLPMLLTFEFRKTLVTKPKR